SRSISASRCLNPRHGAIRPQRQRLQCWMLLAARFPLADQVENRLRQARAGEAVEPVAELRIRNRRIGGIGVAQTGNVYRGRLQVLPRITDAVLPLLEGLWDEVIGHDRCL